MTKKFLITAFVAICVVPAVFAARQSTGKLAGKIEDSKGKPIAGAEVRVMRHRDRSVKETTTDQSGHYSFELLPDDYTVSFDAEGFRGGTLVQMQQVEAGKETTVKTIRLEKEKRSSLVRGAVFDASGISLGGARVKLQRIPTEEEAKEKKKIDSLTRDYITNSRGEFAFRLPAVRARYQLTAMLSGYKSETKVVEVNESEAVPVAFSLEPLKK
ncbi:MAG TPA: carboxypeptidase-like regulatory domain-containing protein [Blastocatellia bacterium]|nr:carboxypeptidase-like regulatory domain-containing protein [Blastocatellia bacterium]